MKIAVGIYNNKQLETLSPYIDTAILMTPHYAYVYEDLDLDEALDYCKKNNIEPVISLMRIVMENELQIVSSFIEKYREYKFIVSDLGIVQLFKEKGLVENVIYDPTTLVCNSLDLELYSSFGFNAVGMSNEITVQDVITAYNYSKSPIFYQIFGRKMMYYSKRRLISTYKEYRDLSFETKHLFLREEKRDYDIPVYENENGTFCYRPYNISLLEELNNISFLKYGYFETLNCENEKLIEVLKIYKDALSEDPNNEVLKQRIEALNLPIEDGFAYSDTVHVKEKIVQCKR